MDKTLEILKYSPLFSEIAEQDLQNLFKCLLAKRKIYSKTEFIFSAGDTLEAVGIVLCGSVHILREDYWGNRTILARIEQGGLFGEAFSCAQTSNIPVSAMAAEQSEILLIDYARIITNCSSECHFHTELIKNMMKILAQKNIMLTQKMEIITHRTTRERVLAYLSAQAIKTGKSRFSIPFDRQELADYLSVERSAMSAELSKMQADGLIWTKRSEFELLV